jgi:hypothetical protein
VERNAKQGNVKMLKLIKTLPLAALLAMSVLPSTGNASAFVAWKVTDVPFGDVLNVRKYPSPHSQKQAANPNGKVLSMTGKCTGGVDLFDIAGLPKWKQRLIVKGLWCQLWHDPAGNGNFKAGWVRMNFMRPT